MRTPTDSPVPPASDDMSLEREWLVRIVYAGSIKESLREMRGYGDRRVEVREGYWKQMQESYERELATLKDERDALKAEVERLRAAIKAAIDRERIRLFNICLALDCEHETECRGDRTKKAGRCRRVNDVIQMLQAALDGKEVKNAKAD